jgi:hypothetical protein
MSSSRAASTDRPMSSPRLSSPRDLLSLVIEGCEFGSPSFLLVSDLTGCYEVVLDLHEQDFVGEISIEASCT